jgi:fructose/tagatose bisphosphate aldolase
MMSIFVEVDSIEKGCPVIINLDHIIEIAPLKEGGSALFMTDGAGMNSKMSVRVSNNYSEFKQFVMQTVSADDIAKRFPTKTKADKLEIPKL